MANKYVGIRDGGKTDEEGALTRLLNMLAGTQNEGIIGTGDFAVTEQGTPTMDVDIATGDIVINYTDYLFHCWSTAVQTLTIGAADPTNPRKDRIVAYVDLTVVDDTNPNNPDAILFKDVQGTPAGSPVEPDDSAVQTAVGSGNPWDELAMIDVAALASSIVDANITDRRGLFQLGGGQGGPQFTVKGDLIVVDDPTPFWVAVRAGTFTAIYARVKTAPTGQALNVRVDKNGVSAGTVSIAAGSTNDSSTGLSISYNAGDYFNIDVTQVGSTVSGSALTCAVA